MGGRRDEEIKNKQRRAKRLEGEGERDKSKLNGIERDVGKKLK